MIKQYIPSSIITFASEWSMFDMLCLIFVVKNWFGGDILSVLSAFIYSSDPHEAQVMLHHMRADHKKDSRINEPNNAGLDVSNVFLSKSTHANLF